MEHITSAEAQTQAQTQVFHLRHSWAKYGKSAFKVDYEREGAPKGGSPEGSSSSSSTMIYGKILEIYRKYMPKICPKMGS